MLNLESLFGFFEVVQNTVRFSKMFLHFLKFVFYFCWLILSQWVKIPSDKYLLISGKQLNVSPKIFCISIKKCKRSITFSLKLVINSFLVTYSPFLFFISVIIFSMTCKMTIIIKNAGYTKNDNTCTTTLMQNGISTRL